MTVSNRTYYTLRRLHSLSGVVPIGLFLLEHLFTNARSLQGPQAFDRAAAELAAIPFVVVLEAAGIWIPILFHMGLGIVIASTAQANAAARGSATYWQYVLQRVTGVVLAFYLVFHTWSTRFSGEYLHSVSAYDYVQRHLAPPGVFALYVVGVLAACYHFGNGLFGFAIHWGVATGARAQRNAARLGFAVFVALSLLGLASLFGFRGLRLDFLQKPHAHDTAIVTMTGGPR